MLFKTRRNILSAAALLSALVACDTYEDTQQWETPAWSSDDQHILVPLNFFETKTDAFWGVNRSRNYSFELHTIPMSWLSPQSDGNLSVMLSDHSASTALLSSPGGSRLVWEGKMSYGYFYMKSPDDDGYYIIVGRELKSGHSLFEKIDVSAGSRVVTKVSVIVSGDEVTQYVDYNACPMGGGQAMRVIPSRDGRIIALLKHHQDCSHSVQFMDHKLSPLGAPHVFSVADGPSGFFVSGWSRRDITPQRFFVGVEYQEDDEEKSYGQYFDLSDDLSVETGQLGAEDAFPPGCIWPQSSSSRFNDAYDEAMVFSDELIVGELFWNSETSRPCPEH